MADRIPIEERLVIYDRHVAGESLHVIAEDLGIHYETARKWWRVGRDQGREALGVRPRKPIGRLRNVPPKVIKTLHTLRKRHSSWGVPYLRQQLLAHPDLTEEERARVPSQATLYRHLHAVEPQPFGGKTKNRVPTTPLINQTKHPHHLWQVDLKERCRVKGLDHRVTVINLRDVYSSVTIGAHVFELTRTSGGVTMADVQDCSRLAFAKWGLPDRIRTDKGTCFVGTTTQTGFPSYFTLWLAGLQIEHETIQKGKVTQNGCIERFNRTYSNLVLKDGPFRSAHDLRTVSEATLRFLNTEYPSHAGRCRGRPPLKAHPEAEEPRRRYTRRQERKLFSLERVDALLAKFRWQRRSDGVGKASMGRTDYYLGRANRKLVFDVTFEPKDRTFVFTTPDQQITITRPALGLDIKHILDIRTSQRQRLRNSEKRTALRSYDK